MKRQEWTFDIAAAELAKASQAKVIHHTDRLSFWKGSQEKVMQEVREKGLSIETSAAGFGYSGSNVRPKNMPQIVIDDTYQRRLEESNEKIQEHQRKLSEYEGWVQVMADNQSRTYPLNADDYLFFFGK